ncbi:MAG TPA: hypothetical protein VK964_12455 [Nocardioidaceae bacterium]|nr:hypothetical protein [Nocardioidaceae bacterium]
MPIRVLRVLGISAKVPASEPLVIAIADDQLVKFSRRDGWTCDCHAEGDECPHVDAVADLLDDRVLGDAG